jgi:ABC-2 type transport system ATP-binding protein
MEPVVAADGVGKTYGDVTAVADVSVSVGAGEVFALVGPNGAGKTTLVRCLTGTTEPDGGEVRLLGRPPGEVERSRLGLLPQAFAPPERLTPRELVSYYAGLYDEARGPEATLLEVGLDPGRETWYGDLSGGEQRRVCVAVALVNDPDVLFLDEPTTGIDPGGRRALWDVIEDLAAGGTTVVLTTHYMAEAERLADRVGLLADGRLAAVGPPADLVAAHAGASRLEMATDADPGALADSRFDARRGDDGLVLEGVSPGDIGDVVRALDRNGVAFDTLSWSEPDLEDAYLALTGERPGAEPREVEA